jgi:hypothetical protein
MCVAKTCSLGPGSAGWVAAVRGMKETAGLGCLLGGIRPLLQYRQGCVKNYARLTQQEPEPLRAPARYAC